MFNIEYIKERISLHPEQGETWEKLTEDEKKGYLYHIFDLLNSHKWKGTPINTPFQGDAFPRKIGCSVLYWDNSVDSPPPLNHTQGEGGYIVLSSYWIVQGLAFLLAIKKYQVQKQITLKAAGIESVKVGPLESKFDTKKDYNTPLPPPLWDNLREYSLLDDYSDGVPYLTGDLIKG